MDSFTVEGIPAKWPKAFVAMAGESKLGKDLLDAAEKLADAATSLLPTEIEGEPVTKDPNVRVQVLATDSGGYARFMLDVYVTP